MRISALLVAVIVLAGCIQSEPGRDSTPPMPESTGEAWQILPPGNESWNEGNEPADPGNASFQEPYTFFDEAGGPDLEGSVATHPVDADTVLLTWTVRGDVLQVWAAVTQDGGATWRKTPMHDPALDALPGPYLSWDSKAAFLPDGTAAVLFAGEAASVTDQGPGVVDLVARITLALSRDGGATWEYHRIAEDPGLTWDYTDFAVAPDTGRIHVTAYSFALQGTNTWIWTSDDEGQTWERKPLVIGHDAVAYMAARVSAGPDGLVLVVATDTRAGALTRGRGLFAIRSTDGGETFEPAEVVGPPSLVRSGPGISLDPAGGVQAVLAFATPDEIGFVRSADGGATWSEPQTLTHPPSGMTPSWVVSAATPSGALAALALFESTDPLRYAVSLTIEDPSGAPAEFALAGPRDGHPLPPGVDGNEYGGLAFAADGTAWVAWADPAPGGTRMALAHLRAPLETDP